MTAAVKKKKKTRIIEDAEPELIRARRISEREKEVLQLVAEGYKNREIAKKLQVKVKTIETHRANIMNKLALRNISDLIRYAVHKEIIVIKVDKK
ncbi:MAG: helix-turn-helix transcriptional regulator [Nitrospirae bacterium]|nr:helix-turn-helix transcriptional regulator [Candidatus Manganitrophaceae bacterium]